MKKNRNEAIFRGKIGMKGSLIIYRASKTKTKAKLAKSWPKPDRSREKARYLTKSTKSPLHANRDSGVGRWRGQRDTKHGTVGF